MGILVVKHFIAHGQPLQPESQQLQGDALQLLQEADRKP